MTSVTLLLMFLLLLVVVMCFVVVFVDVLFVLLVRFLLLFCCWCFCFVIDVDFLLLFMLLVLLMSSFCCWWVCFLVLLLMLFCFVDAGDVFAVFVGDLCFVVMVFVFAGSHPQQVHLMTLNLPWILAYGSRSVTNENQRLISERGCSLWIPKATLDHDRWNLASPKVDYVTLPSLSAT